MSPTTSEADLQDMKARIESELSKQKRRDDSEPDIDALTAVSVGYLEHMTSPGFSFLDDLIGKIVDIRTQLAATLVDCYLRGSRPNLTRDVYKPQFRGSVDTALKQFKRKADEEVRETLTCMALGMWKDERDLRAARGPLAMMVVSYYVWGSD